MKKLSVLLVMVILTFSCAKDQVRKPEPRPAGYQLSPAEIISGFGPQTSPLPPIISAPYVPQPQPAIEYNEPISIVKGGEQLDTIGDVRAGTEIIKLETAPNQIKTTFAVKTSKTYLWDVAVVAECVIHDNDFLNEVAAHKQFFDTKLTSAQVSARMRDQYRPVVISTYSKRFTSTIAYRNVGSNVLYFNLRMNPRAMKYMVNTAIHEWLHVQGFGHSVKYTSNRPNSVPYAVGKIAEKYSDRCNKTKTK